MPNYYNGKYSTKIDAPMTIEEADRNAISPAEAVAKSREENKKLASARRIDDQDTLEDHEMAQGIQLHHNELIRRIQLLNPKIQIQQGGVANAVAVRIPKYEFGEWTYEYVTGFYLEPLPEFSSVTVDAQGLPHREVRGWRSVLLALIKSGALDRRKVDVMFGPARGQRSGIWYRSLQYTN